MKSLSKKKEALKMEIPRNKEQINYAEAYMSNNLQLQKNSLNLLLKSKWSLSATNVLSQSKPMAYNTTASLVKLTFADYVDFGKCQGSFGWFTWSKNDSHYLAVKFKVFKRDDKRDFLLVLNLTIGESDFNQINRMRNQLVVAVEHLARKESLSSVQIPTMSKGTDE